MIKYMSKFKLNGKIACVVGGMGLIGREVSIAYAMAGAKTFVFDVNMTEGKKFEKKMREKGYDLTFSFFDCVDMENLDEQFAVITNRLKRLDIFINCSYPRTKDWSKSSFKDITLNSFRENIDIHLNSYSWLAKLAAEAMVSNGNGGSIIQLASIYGVVGQDLTVYEGTDMHENMTYAVIKGGVTNLTRLMASYYGIYSIRVNTICAGGLVGHVAGQSDIQDPMFVENYSKKVPLKRLGNPDEIASVSLFLASDAASYITGSTVMVDGGWTAI